MTDTFNIVEQIRNDRNDLSRAFKAIADYLVTNPGQFIRSPMRELSRAIGVSEPTLIRFSRHYGYGGFPDLRLAIAMSLASANTSIADQLEPNLTDKEGVHPLEKRAIALSTLPLVETDQSILLDSGSTVKYLAELLQSAKSLTILTSGINTLMLLKDSHQHEIILPGGVFRPEAMSIGGRMTEGNLAGMSFDTAYLGADSIHPEFGLSTFSEEEAHLNRAMLQACRRVVVLADASKFGSPALHKICDLEQVDIVVTDDNLSAELRNQIIAQGAELVIANVPKIQSIQQEVM